jgi:hypothetical protein
MESSGLPVRWSTAIAAIATVLAIARGAGAQGTPDAAEPKPSPWAGVQRPWLYTADPSAPPPAHVLASMSVGYSSIDKGAARPFAADRTHAGAIFSAGAEVGVLRFASIQAEGLLAGQGASKSVAAGAMVGANFYPLPKRLPVAMSISAGYLRELGGANGIWGRATVAGDIGPVRLGMSAVGSHVFAPGRDEVDLLLTAAVTYRVVSILRIGAEYVVQDIEGAWDPEEADGGIRHFVGPTASLELAKRIFLTAGPAFGLSSGSPRLLGRLTANYAF